MEEWRGGAAAPAGSASLSGASALVGRAEALVAQHSTPHAVLRVDEQSRDARSAAYRWIIEDLDT